MADQMVTKEEATITITRTNFYLGKQVSTKEKVDKIQVRAFATDPAKVNIAFSRKLNMGNYESLGIDIGVSVPCYLEEIKDIVPQVIEYVQGELDREVKKAGGRSLEIDLNELD